MEKERPKSAHYPIAHGQVRCSLASPAEDDQLLLEEEILGDDGADPAGAAEPRGGNAKVENCEEDSVHTRVSVGRVSAAWNPAPPQNSWEN